MSDPLILMKLAGKKVTITFVVPVHANGYEITEVTGEFGGGTFPGPFALNDVSRAIDVNGKDVLKESKLLGAVVMGDSRNIQIIAGPVA